MILFLEKNLILMLIFLDSFAEEIKSFDYDVITTSPLLRQQFKSFKAHRKLSIASINDFDYFVKNVILKIPEELFGIF